MNSLSLKKKLAIGFGTLLLILIALGGVIAYMVWHFFKKPVSTGDPADAPFVETVTHVPVIKQVTEIIEGKQHEMVSGTSLPDNYELGTRSETPPAKTESLPADSPKE